MNPLTVPVALLYFVLACLAASQAHGNTTVSRPNILFIFTDDQDLELGSLNYLPKIRERVQDQGFTFNNHYATVALCCPSRVALLRGQHAHNTNNTFVQAQGGGYDKFRLSGEDQDYLPQWLRKAGYRSEYIGKLMNQYGIYNYNITPKGWDHFDGLLDPYTYTFNTPVFSQNGQRPIYYANQHQTDVIRAKAADRLTRLLANPDQPWYLQVAPVAPHQQFNDSGRYPPVPLLRHENLYPGLTAPRTPNFNPVVQDKPSWLGEIPQMNASQIAFSDETYRRRAQALAGIDEMVSHLLDILAQAGKLDDTLILFSSDHGYHVGQHRVPAGKTLPYREDTHVPFFVKGPGIPKGQSTLAPSTHVDLAPTILSFAGLSKNEWPPFLDGRDLTSDWNGSAHTNASTEVINIEFWGLSGSEGALIISNATRNTYKTIRIIGPDYGYLYTRWCTNETEIYDTVIDPYEQNRIQPSAQPSLANRLNGILLATKTCVQDSCRDPWSYLHPGGSVHNLKDALDPIHDQYYASLPQVSFKECLLFQSPRNEEPFFPGFDPNAPYAFAQQYRNSTALLGSPAYPGTNDAPEAIPELGHFGAVYQGLAEIEKDARVLTDEELASTGQGTRKRAWPLYG
ncbi:hypothetical protein LTR05_005490 [Lithohypha guttulata]|uniref:Sulfatase N-terminal domain-containing protein n=1 Tax=Lithohypha guttulata TaxID=1690604 RepID=A0AAN7Y601_9EURO|nr:hypothetical protein LTR05_005490 [Lithohypha guttulata]